MFKTVFSSLLLLTIFGSLSLADKAVNPITDLDVSDLINAGATMTVSLRKDIQLEPNSTRLYIRGPSVKVRNEHSKGYHKGHEAGCSFDLKEQVPAIGAVLTKKSPTGAQRTFVFSKVTKQKSCVAPGICGATYLNFGTVDDPALGELTCFDKTKKSALELRKMFNEAGFSVSFTNVSAPRRF